MRDLLRVEPVSAIFCEFPSNPLLVSPDLAALSELARQHGFPLVVDETLGTYVNTDVLRVADVAVTSLTKYFTGAGDVLAGAAIIHPQGPLADRLRESLDQEYEDTLWDGMRSGSPSTPPISRIASTGSTARPSRFATFAGPTRRSRKSTIRSIRTPANYEAFQRPGGGYGGLFSLLLKDPKRTAPRFYDSLQLCKGPNLGVNFSLCCPFTLLAHYRELDFVERCGVAVPDPDLRGAGGAAGLDRSLGPGAAVVVTLGGASSKPVRSARDSRTSKTVASGLDGVHASACGRCPPHGTRYSVKSSGIGTLKFAVRTPDA